MRVLVIDSETMGGGDQALGARLIVKFIHQLAGLPTHPDAVVFYNAGVRLLARDSVALDTLQRLEHAGVELLVCGTCVEHFGLAGRMGAGRVTDMREITATLMGADRVVTL
ncbi:MAG TPA: DsrE family protein [Vicinamibacterales bacterium]|nr:DsrE family protein [Vicinamibacterales bacterium]